MKERKMPFLGIGAASIVLVLAVVCLSVFAVLTLSSAQGDYALSKKNLNRTTSYYEASNAVNEQISQIDDRLFKIYKKSKNKKDYMKRVNKKISKMEGITYHKKKKTIEFQQKITEKQQISVKLKVHYPKKKKDPCYEVLKWKNESVGAWQKDDSLPVYQRK